ncbi:receptor-like cytosolic serine/threonine-protein kinase RBK1 [Humulus lupulus]|uniref:receptor-like cytosolic serine/threonine-protein kinase RBK1 n=1 Tax=Humulus lupulus TaxID=3486 RepID=UPI002B4100B1|nr:receptor-like cytosolic serine/threonine-protein kinase RBK1 [Humulus lupulus]
MIMEETGVEEKETPEMVLESEGKKMGLFRKEEEEKEEASPRGVLEIPILGRADSDDHSGRSTSSSSSDKTTSSLSSLSSSSSSSSPTTTTTSQWRSVFETLKKKSMRRFSTMPLLAASYEISRKGRKLARIRSADDAVSDPFDIPVAKPSWRNFDHSELAAATANFSPENMIGRGGQAEVFKGCLPDGQLVAVKRLTKKEKEKEERIGDFLSELGIIAHIDHPNAAKLLGFGVDGGFHLVLQFSPHGSLASLLFGLECLEWKIRFKVAVGVAQGLQYLHQGCQRRIIHRDIKASNILLTQDYEAQISDFGLAKWLPEKWTHHIVFPIEGTFGYLAPEYFMHGIVDEKTDVFAYGVLLLELITGRRAVDSSQQSLVIWAKPMLDTNNVRELADPRLGNEFDSIEMKRTMLTASMCIHHQSSKRPYMNQVVKILKSEDGHVELKPKTTGAVRSVMLDACDLEDYTCSTYLNDLNRHRQLVME